MNSYKFALLLTLMIQGVLYSDIDRSFSKTDKEIDDYYESAVAERGAKAQRAALAQLKQQIEDCRELPPSEAMAILSQAIGKLTRKNVFQLPERIPVFDQARNQLIAIPGHAHYLSNEILKLKPTWREHSNKVVYDNTRMWTMQTLQHIPSPEVVRVLGEFLSDEEETQRPLTAGGAIDSFGPGSNASLAAEALKTLIAEPPVPKDRMTRKQGDIKAWQIWYENVKSGTLTFRFEGDATEYDLNGPAPKEKLRNIERDRKRDDERAAGHKKSTPSSGSEAPLAQVGKPLSIAGVVIALALVSGAIWYFLRGRKPA